MQLTVHMFQTLDGVVQGPGGPDEDTDGGFARGGWIVGMAEEETFGSVVSGWFERTGALLFGRFTYEVMAGFWPQVTDPADPVAQRINTAPKYVVSSTLTDPGWGETTVLGGDPVAAVRELKERPGGELQVHGSARLARTLHEAGLVDEYRIITFPVVVGDGKRLFGASGPATGFDVVESRFTASGAAYTALRPRPFAFGEYVVVGGKEEKRL